MRPLVRALTLLFAVSVIGCGLFPEKASINDPRVATLLKAAETFDRTKYGFSPLPTSGSVNLESHPRAGYDAMLHGGGKTSRTIAFLKYPDGYHWIGEQEIFRGPKQYESVDGTFYEEVCLTYETHHVTGVPLNRLDVAYRGEDPRVVHPQGLSLEEVKPLLKEWGY